MKSKNEGIASLILRLNYESRGLLWRFAVSKSRFWIGWSFTDWRWRKSSKPIHTSRRYFTIKYVTHDSVHFLVLLLAQRLAWYKETTSHIYLLTAHNARWDVGQQRRSILGQLTDGTPAGVVYWGLHLSFYRSSSGVLRSASVVLALPVTRFFPKHVPNYYYYLNLF